MYQNRRIALVIPAYNEEKLIRDTLAAVPALIDQIYVVDDCSPDHQGDVVEGLAVQDRRIRLLRHTANQGPGGSIVTGYQQASRDGCDAVVVVGGDNQMDLSEVQRFLDPLMEGKADYAKGNRFLLSQLEESIRRMPRTRLFANWLIAAIAKISSGYFKVYDFVDGYTATTKNVIDTINWTQAWRGYGYPMDFLIRLNGYGFRVVDVPRKAIYLPGERQSQIKGLSYALRVTPMLIRGFFWRLNFKYLYRDFHPLIFFYYLSMALVPSGILGGLLLAGNKLFSNGAMVTAPRAILVALLLISGIQFFLFAMLFDMQESQ
jgi:glycosyltransferase involved in cell wall biosynthesis